jgi:predicted ATPase/DNA-binding NarL/FixJ family response regulator
VTLAGPGGSGKTRLAAEVASAVSALYPDGLWWVELAPLTDADLVPRAIATVLGIREQPGKSLLTSIASHLLTRRVLLVLDNCEHLVGATAAIAEQLLRTCPGLHILATSREALAVQGEATFAVAPLSTPDPRQESNAAELAAVEAVELFVGRARDVSPGFVLTETNAAVIASLCRRLDGLPLAIELAAARVRALPVEEIERRMDSRLQLLAGGIRTALPRHQTLRAAMDWSHDLLTEPERRLFRRLAVFPGSASLDAVEAVCADGEDSLADVLSRLVGKSLVVADQTRYRMLEIVREYARESLIDSGEVEGARQRHRDYFLDLAEQADAELRGPRQGSWISRLEVEHDNLLAALEWSLAAGDREQLLRLAASLWRFWNVAGFWGEGQEWLERALSFGPIAASPARAYAAFGAGVLAWYRHDYSRAEELLEESRRLAEAAGDLRLAADALRQLALAASSRQDHDRARELAETSLRLFEALNDKWGIAAASRLLGFHLSGGVGLHMTDRIDLPRAAAYLERSLSLARELSDGRGIANSLAGLSDIARQQQAFSQAVALAEQALKLFEASGDRFGVAVALMDLIHTYRERGETAMAQRLAVQAIGVAREIGDPVVIGVGIALQATLLIDTGAPEQAEAEFRVALMQLHKGSNPGGVAHCLQGLARAAAARRRWKRAATLLAAADAGRRRVRIALGESARREVEALQSTVRAALGETLFASISADAAAMPLHAVVAFAIADTPPGSHRPDQESVLSDREHEVARLVARGFSNREVAATLFLSERTVESHVQHILNKLGFRSRAQIAAWAVANRLQ